jgi:nicotinate-nucleotide adenylyltransferase
MEQAKRLETIIYGGAFNPPTLAHVAILQACVDYARPRGSDVWIMPSGERTDKTIGVSTKRRLEYIAAMIADTDIHDVSMDILTTEMERTVAVETFDTVLELDETYPEREFTWVFGADSTETMADWQNGEWLLENLSMLVFEREGSAVNPMAKRAAALTMPLIPVSSTLMRERLAAKQRIDDLTSPHIAALFA